MSNFYAGSYILSPLGSPFGLSVDKVNYIVCQLVAIAAGSPFQKYFPASPGLPNLHRHIAAIILGSAMCMFCFGHQILHILVQSGVCLLLLRLPDLPHRRFLVSGFAMLYLSACHLMRQYFDYGGYTLDITGPLMIQTQRLMTLAFNLHDGQILRDGGEGEKKAVNERQRRHCVSEMPSLLEYFSYILHFQGILVGPFVFYVDFKNFMEGTAFDREGVDPASQIRFERAVGRKLQVIRWAVVCGFASTVLSGPFSFEYMTTDEYLSSCVLYKWAYLMLAASILRQRYYFAWSLGELSYLYSGCGFSGVNAETKEPEYKIAQNFDFVGVEFASSLKTAVDNWNMSTAVWLRECIYERVPGRRATLAVFVASAAWHGFYPGYYLFFVSMAFFTVVARMFRRRFHPLFLRSSPPAKLLYDVVTGVAALTSLNYSAVGFILLGLGDCVRIWWSVLFCVHIIAAALYFALNHLAARDRKAAKLQEKRQ